MGSLLGELGKKLAERWLALLVLPGALYLAIAAVAVTAGHRHALDVHSLTRQITAWAKAPAAGTAGGQIVLLGAVLAGAAVAGLVAQAAGSLVERLVLAAGWRAWPGPPRRIARLHAESRASRWRAAHSAYHRLREEAARAHARGERIAPAEREAAWRERNRIAAEEPDRPTWSGDRIHAADIRLRRDVHLDLGAVWPYVWLVLPEQVRTEITAARTSLTRATVLAAWAVLYAALTVWWWPAAPLAVVIALTARQRIRSAADAYAQLLEAATRLHLGGLAQQLGLELTGPPTPETGAEISRLLHTQPPPP